MRTSSTPPRQGTSVCSLVSEPCASLYRTASIMNMPQEAISSTGSHSTHVVGDLHGNVIKLLMFLIRFNYIKKPNQDLFRRWVVAYIHPEIIISPTGIDPQRMAAQAQGAPFPSSRNDDLFIQFMDSLLDALELNPDGIANSRLVLIGDVLCDRGQSDVMTLMLLEWMAIQRIQFTVILSNHDLFFLQAYEQNFLNLESTFPYNVETYRSIIPVLSACSTTKAWIKEIVKTVYLPRLRVVDYDTILDKNGTPQLFLYTHAPFVATLFEALMPVQISSGPAQRRSSNFASKLTTMIAGAKQQSFTLGNANAATSLPPLEALKEKIHQVNARFSQEISSRRLFFVVQSKGSSYFEFVWNRNYPDPSTYIPGMINVFGHVSHIANIQPPKRSPLINLDCTALGRPSREGGDTGHLAFLKIVSNDADFIRRHQETFYPPVVTSASTLVGEQQLPNPSLQPLVSMQGTSQALSPLSSPTEVVTLPLSSATVTPQLPAAPLIPPVLTSSLVSSGNLLPASRSVVSTSATKIFPTQVRSPSRSTANPAGNSVTPAPRGSTLYLQNLLRKKNNSSTP